jgi:hypothetical protein
MDPEQKKPEAPETKDSAGEVAISFEALKAARKSDPDWGKTDEVSVKSATEDSQQKVEENKEKAADSVIPEVVDEALLKELGIEETPPARADIPKDRPIENVVAELQRKVEKLAEENKTLKTNPQPVQDVNFEPSEAFKESMEKRYGTSWENIDAVARITNDIIQQTVEPKLSAADNRWVKSEVIKGISDSPIYKLLKEDVDEIVKNDPIVSKLENESDKYKLALDLAKGRNAGKLAQLASARATERAKLNKQIIPSDVPSASPISTKQAKSLSKEDIFYLNKFKRFGLSEADLKDL